MERDSKRIEQEGGPSLTDEQVDEIREVLSKYQSLQYSGITLENASEALNDLGIFYTEAEVAQMFKDFVMEDNDEISVEQFLHAMTKVYQQLNDIETLKAAFKVFDSDDTGFFKTTELRPFALTMGVKFTDEEFDDMINEVDTDHDGKIAWEEFFAASKS